VGDIDVSDVELKTKYILLCVDICEALCNVVYGCSHSDAIHKTVSTLYCQDR